MSAFGDGEVEHVADRPRDFKRFDNPNHPGTPAIEEAVPGLHALVGREDHRAPAPMPLVDDVEDHVGGGGEVGVEAVLIRPMRDGDRQMRLPAARFPGEDRRAALGDKVRREGRVEHGHPQGRLIQEVEVVNGLEKGTVRPAGEAREPRLPPMGDLLGDQRGEEVPIAPRLLLGATARRS